MVLLWKFISNKGFTIYYKLLILSLFCVSLNASDIVQIDKTYLAQLEASIIKAIRKSKSVEKDNEKIRKILDDKNKIIKELNVRVATLSKVQNEEKRTIAQIASMTKSQGIKPVSFSMQSIEKYIASISPKKTMSLKREISGTKKKNQHTKRY